MSSPASSWSRITTRVASWNASLCAARLNASSRSLPASWWVNHPGRGYDPTIVVGSNMRRGYHSRRAPGHGQVAVVPLRRGSPVLPHVTSHAAPTQLSTVHPVAGHVTWHSGLDPQSTVHDAAALHSTWQCSPGAQPTEHGSPGAHCTSQALPPAEQSWLHGSDGE